MDWQDPNGERRTFFRQQARCRTATARLVTNRTLPRPPWHCENSGDDFCDVRPRAHHPDYANPRLVMWLCHRCHALWHGEMDRLLNRLTEEEAETLAQRVVAKARKMQIGVRRGRPRKVRVPA